MPRDVHHWIDWVWVLVGICWLVGALRSKPVARRQQWQSRVFHITIMAVALVLLFSSSARIGVLAERFLPESSWIGWTGLGITIAGCAFAVWARVLLGRNWSAAVTVKQQHAFIRSGPYAIVRHPIYSGFLLGILGTALALGEVRGLLALALAFAGYITKACTEERFLVEQFGDAYIGYRQKVKRLIPFVF
jgi:protein-S-isoprenylcysteine O-methyltransferase Ste14